MQKSQYEQWDNAATIIANIPVGTKAIDYAGCIVTIKRHEDSLTWATRPGEPQPTCYANCAKLIVVAN